MKRISTDQNGEDTNTTNICSVTVTVTAKLSTNTGAQTCTRTFAASAIFVTSLHLASANTSTNKSKWDNREVVLYYEDAVHTGACPSNPPGYAGGYDKNFGLASPADGPLQSVLAPAFLPAPGPDNGVPRPVG